GFFQRHFLMPAVHAANGVGLNGKRQVLRHAPFAPPDPLRIRIVAGERDWPFDLPDKPFSWFWLRDLHNVGTIAIARGILTRTPAPEVVRAGDHAGPNPLGQPNAIDEVADCRPHAHQITVGEP